MRWVRLLTSLTGGSCQRGFVFGDWGSMYISQVMRVVEDMIGPLGVEAICVWLLILHPL